MTSWAERLPRSAASHYVGPAFLVAGVAALAISVARWAWDAPAVVAFIARYPGVSPGAAQEGTPIWVVTLHALNLFFLAQIVRSGIAVRTARRPVGHWTPPFPTPTGGRHPEPITIEQWVHVRLDLLWLACGGVFLALLVATGRWVRLVPTSWDVLPNALSVALQYLSLHWPEHDSWVAYNALQQLSYFAVVFVLAPLAAATGLRLSPLWPARARLNRRFTIERARAVHFPVMIAFVVFVVVHLALVASSGAVRTLNHMFAARADDSPAGVLMLCGVLALSAAANAASRPIVLRALAGLTGKVTR